MASRFFDYFINWQKLLERENTNGNRLMREIDEAQHHYFLQLQFLPSPEPITLSTDVDETTLNGSTSKESETTSNGPTSKENETPVDAAVDSSMARSCAKTRRGRVPSEAFLPSRIPTDGKSVWARWADTEYDHYMIQEELHRRRMDMLQKQSMANSLHLCVNSNGSARAGVRNEGGHGDGGGKGNAVGGVEKQLEGMYRRVRKMKRRGAVKRPKTSQSGNTTENAAGAAGQHRWLKVNDLEGWEDDGTLDQLTDADLHAMNELYQRYESMHVDDLSDDSEEDEIDESQDSSESDEEEQWPALEEDGLPVVNIRSAIKVPHDLDVYNGSGMSGQTPERRVKIDLAPVATPQTAELEGIIVEPVEEDHLNGMEASTREFEAFSDTSTTSFKTVDEELCGEKLSFSIDSPSLAPIAEDVEEMDALFDSDDETLQTNVDEDQDCKEKGALLYETTRTEIGVLYDSSNETGDINNTLPNSTTNEDNRTYQNTDTVNPDNNTVDSASTKLNDLVRPQTPPPQSPTIPYSSTFHSRSPCMGTTIHSHPGYMIKLVKSPPTSPIALRRSVVAIVANNETKSRSGCLGDNGQSDCLAVMDDLQFGEIESEVD